MAVAEMSVMTLVGLERDKSAVLDALSDCSAAQIRQFDPSCESLDQNGFAENQLLGRVESVSVDALVAEADRVEKAIGIISSAVDELPEKTRPQIEKDGFGATKDEFFKMSDRREEFLSLVENVEAAASSRANVKAERAALITERRSYEPYTSLKEPFSFYADTAKTAVYLGTIASEKTSSFLSKTADNGLIAELLGGVGGQTVVAVVVEKPFRAQAETLLNQAGFVKSPFSGETTAAAEISKIDQKIASLDIEDKKLHVELLSLIGTVRQLKLYADYLGFLKEKTEADLMMGKTQSTYLLQAYVPTEAQEMVENRLKSTGAALFLTFEVVPRDKFAPTLNRNGKAVRNFEVVTNMYSSPAYGALDPNAVMSFFFSLFMGVIMADVGYGLLMVVGGFIFAKTKREGTSVNRMAKVFAYGGFFAIIFGAVFDSFMGFPLLRNVLGEGYNAFYSAHLDQITAMTSVAGVNVPAILMWCLALGTAQMAVGLVLKAVQSFTRGKVLEGIFGGIVWAIALFALIVWVYAMCTGLGAVQTYSMYVLLGSVVIGVLTAGIGEKGFGIVTKSFTSAYGLINYVSDILSYARLYGLMLSGAQIASIFTNTLAIGMLFPSGPVGVVAGVVLIIIGNVFNLAISLLGAYIHDARLQYVEFFGKFYEGEGELFTPFGSKTKHSYFKG